MCENHDKVYNPFGSAFIRRWICRSCLEEGTESPNITFEEYGYLLSLKEFKKEKGLLIENNKE